MNRDHSPLRRRLTLAGLAALGAVASGARAQPQWPSRAVKLLVGFPPGTTSDMMARVLGPALAKSLGQPLIVDNRPGAGGNIAAELLARAQDAYTLGLVSTGPLTTASALYEKLTFDPEREIAPLCLVGAAPMVLATAANQKAASLAELLQTLRAGGDRINYASVGVGSAAHLGMELIKARTGITAVHVPYPGAPQILTALVRGDVQAALLAPAAAMPQAAAGKLKAWAVTSSRPSALAPGLPPLGEAGVEGMDFQSWNALCAPSTLPPAARQQVAAATVAIVRSQEVRQQLLSQGWDPLGLDTKATLERIRQDAAMLKALVVRLKLRLD